MTPNEKYAALVEVAGYVPVPLSAGDYIELLPASWRTINCYGIRINNRTYDARALNPYRRQHSGVASKNGRWEVHHDPYDVSRVWLRNHHDGGWITATWTHLRSAPVPFGETAWRHAQLILAQRGQNQASETEIAAAADELLDRAGQGPTGTTGATTSARTRRVAGRARATAAAALSLRSDAATAGLHGADVADQDADDDDTADVIPLPVFDARKEAERWRM